MIFTMDVGNTNIKTALFEGREMRNYWRISTNTSYTSDEYGLILEGLFARAGLSLDAVEGIVMSSVVPTINFTLEHMCKNYFGKMPMTVAPGIKTGINLRYENPRELGSDRIANAVAAYELAVLNAFKDVRDALVQQQEYANSVQALTSQVEYLTKAVEHARTRYDSGFASYLDLLTSESNLFTAQQSLAAAHAQHLVSIAEVCLALGGGWQE